MEENTCNVSVPGLKRDRYREPIFDSTSQLYFRGNETRAHCKRVEATVLRQPIDIQDLLTNSQLSGDYGPDDFLRSIPKQSTLKPEGFQGNVAENQYGPNYDRIMQVDNDHLLSIPRIDSFATNKTSIDLKKTPSITTDITNSLRTPVKLTIDGKIIVGDKVLTKTVPKSSFRDGQKMNIQNIDFSIMEKDLKTSMSKRAVRQRVERIVKTLSVGVKDPAMSKDISKLLRENNDILHSVVAYAKKDPKFQVVLDNLMKEHVDIFKLGLTGYGYKQGKVTGKSVDKNIREKEAVSVCAPIGSISSKAGMEKGMSSTCFLDDRFVSPDQLEPLTSYVIPPKPVELSIPFGNRCRKFEL
jgi:hypothetical protein